MAKLDKVCTHIMIHTGQSFDDNMSDIFFRELNIRKPDYNLGIAGGDFADQFGKLSSGIRDVILKENPDRLLILGDTNSALSALIAKRMGVKVYHMEAGNRCFDDRVPEEVNRRVIDHCSDVHMPYTERSRANLLREGIDSQNIFVTGNPIWEVIKDTRDNEPIFTELDIAEGEYFLVTSHRQENVDNVERMLLIINVIQDIWKVFKYPIVFSCHPRTKAMIKRCIPNMDYSYIYFHEPFGILDFLTLERNALCVLTDSGTVQEECCLFKVPCVTIRDTTERPETIECGSNALSGIEPESVLRCVKTVLSQPPAWTPPTEYLKTDVSDTVVKIVTGYSHV